VRIDQRFSVGIPIGNAITSIRCGRGSSWTAHRVGQDHMGDFLRDGLGLEDVPQEWSKLPCPRPRGVGLAATEDSVA
jgi:hypothetical protein